jgi:hypothetical protein
MRTWTSNQHAIVLVEMFAKAKVGGREIVQEESVRPIRVESDVGGWQRTLPGEEAGTGQKCLQRSLR